MREPAQSQAQSAADPKPEVYPAVTCMVYHATSGALFTADDTGAISCWDLNFPVLTLLQEQRAKVRMARVKQAARIPGSRPGSGHNTPVGGRSRSNSIDSSSGAGLHLRRPSSSGVASPSPLLDALLDQTSWIVSHGTDAGAGTSQQSKIDAQLLAAFAADVGVVAPISTGCLEAHRGAVHGLKLLENEWPGNTHHAVIVSWGQDGRVCLHNIHSGIKLGELLQRYTDTNTDATPASSANNASGNPDSRGRQQQQSPSARKAVDKPVEYTAPGWNFHLNVQSRVKRDREFITRCIEGVKIAQRRNEREGQLMAYSSKDIKLNQAVDAEFAQALDSALEGLPKYGKRHFELPEATNAQKAKLQLLTKNRELLEKALAATRSAQRSASAAQLLLTSGGSERERSSQARLLQRSASDVSLDNMVHAILTSRDREGERTPQTTFLTAVDPTPLPGQQQRQQFPASYRGADTPTRVPAPDFAPSLLTPSPSLLALATLPEASSSVPASVPASAAPSRRESGNNYNYNYNESVPPLSNLPAAGDSRRSSLASRGNSEPSSTSHLQDAVPPLSVAEAPSLLPLDDRPVLRPSRRQSLAHSASMPTNLRLEVRAPSSRRRSQSKTPNEPSRRESISDNQPAPEEVAVSSFTLDKQLLHGPLKAAARGLSASYRMDAVMQAELPTSYVNDALRLPGT